MTTTDRVVATMVPAHNVAMAAARTGQAPDQRFDHTAYPRIFKEVYETSRLVIQPGRASPEQADAPTSAVIAARPGRRLAA